MSTWGFYDWQARQAVGPSDAERRAPSAERRATIGTSPAPSTSTTNSNTPESRTSPSLTTTGGERHRRRGRHPSRMNFRADQIEADHPMVATGRLSALPQRSTTADDGPFTDHYQRAVDGLPAFRHGARNAPSLLPTTVSSPEAAASPHVCSGSNALRITAMAPPSGGSCRRRQRTARGDAHCTTRATPQPDLLQSKLERRSGEIHATPVEFGRDPGCRDYCLGPSQDAQREPPACGRARASWSTSAS